MFMKEVGFLETIIIVVIVTCTAFLSTGAEAVLENFGLISWLIIAVFCVIALIQGNKHTKEHQIAPELSYSCAFISQLTYAFLVILAARDLTLVASEGILGLFGIIFLAPITGIGLAVCKAPNIIACEDPNVIVLDAIATPILSLLMCWIFKYFDSVEPVLQCMFGI